MFLSKRGQVAPVRWTDRGKKGRLKKEKKWGKKSKQSGICSERDRNDKRLVRNSTHAIGKMKDTPEEGLHFPSVVYGYYLGVRAPWEEWMVFQLRLSVVAAPPSIQTPRDSITTWWARMENQSGGYGDNRESNVWTLGTTQTGNLQWWRGFLFLLSNPAHPPASPSSLTALYRSALPADRPDTCHTHSHSSPRPFFLYPFTSSLGELKQRWNSMKGNGWETCLNWGWLMWVMILLKFRRFVAGSGNV